MDISWTKHSEDKMKFYRLSKQRVRRVLNSPERTEEGIAPGTIAMMQRAGSRKHPYEIWIMISTFGRSPAGRVKNKKGRKIISAWKYPGITKPGEPLPEEILREIEAVK